MSEKKEVRELLEEEIKKEIEELGNFEQGSKEHTAAVENLAKLYRLKIEETKNDWESMRSIIGVSWTKSPANGMNNSKRHSRTNKEGSDILDGV